MLGLEYRFALDFIVNSMCNASSVQSLNILAAAVLTDETRYRILKLLEVDPHASQRRIADELGISLGRVNFCLQACSVGLGQRFSGSGFYSP